MEKTILLEESIHQGILDAKGNKKSPWLWIPTANFASCIPYAMVMTVSVIMYKNMGLSNALIAAATSLLYLPWVLKSLWSPVVDYFSTKRKWMLVTQFLAALCFAGIAICVEMPFFFVLTMAFFWILAFTSATYDIACDGFYMLALSQKQQSWFVGIRSTFYRLASLTSLGLIPIIAGLIQSHTGLDPVKIRAESIMEAKHIVAPVQKQLEPSEKMKIIVFPQDIKLLPGMEKEVQISLSKQPGAGQEVLVTFWFSSGDNKSLKLRKLPPDTKGPRPEEQIVSFAFTQDNWNEAKTVWIASDKKNKEAAFAIFQATSGNIPFSWMVTFFLIALLFAIFSFWHIFFLPYPVADTSLASRQSKDSTFRSFFQTEFWEVFASFFRKKNLGPILFYLLLYRFAESQLVKLAAPFLLDDRDKGGLGLSTAQVGISYGTIGTMGLILGGILGGFALSKYGLKKCMFWMALAMNLPDILYVYLALVQPESYTIINTCIGVEQFGYGFGFTGYMLFMILCAQGEHKASHYAICTCLMALGMMLPGMISGVICEWLGYHNFFIWVCLATIPSFAILKFLEVDPEFGKRAEKA
ncbi:MAG: MFS transporter [Candidatus Brocadiae bacterium]|nr:MFS transporter [Candidatus Brocadiia bacterium]